MDSEGRRVLAGMRALRAAMAACAFVLACVCVAVFPRAAFADLTIYVGYAGGPYYEKAYFSDAELASMADATVYEYTSFDTAGYLRKGFGQGVKLETLFLKAGVDPWSLWRFYFGTTDSYIPDDGGYGANGEAWYYSSLAGSSRYYYPDYLEYANFENGRAVVDAEFYSALQSTAKVVPTILALKSSFARIASADDVQWETQDLGTGAGQRLMFGEASPCSGGARDSAQQVRSITCILGGSSGTDLPKIDFGDLDMSGAKVGDTFTFTPSITNAQDELIAQLGPADINWKVVDPQTGVDVEGVLDVVKNADGTVTITVLSAGNVSLVATFGNSDYNEFVSSVSQGFSGGSGADGAGGAGSGAGVADAAGTDSGAGISGGAGGDADAPSPENGEGTASAAEAVSIEAGVQMQQVQVASATSAGAETATDLEVIEPAAAGGTGADGLAIYQLMTGQSDMEVTVSETPSAVFVLLVALLVLGVIRRIVLFALAKDKRKGKGTGSGAGVSAGGAAKGEKCLA